MKRFLTSVKQEAGFTLIELMVVVAIIGLLSAVAVPNFKKYQAKSKVTEAKLHLSAIYTAEAAFFSDYNMYAGCLKYAGYDPENEKLSRYYAMGFPEGLADISASAHLSAQNSGMNSTECPAAADTDGRAFADAGTSFYTAGKGIGAVIISDQANFVANTAGTASVGTQAANASMIFTAMAVGIISGDAATNLLASVLTVNEKKIISNPQNGY